MAEELVYDACLEVYPDGSCLAQLIDMPACFARGTDQTQALAALESSIAAYFEWLARHDEYTPIMHGPFRVAAAETVRAIDGSPGAFFHCDAPALGADDLDWYATLLSWSYQDYEAALAVRTFAVDSPAMQAARRVCETQAWLLTRYVETPLGAAPTFPRLLPAQLVGHVHGLVLERVRSASSDDRSRIHDIEGERWSLRKVLRRSIFLVREATADLGG